METHRLDATPPLSDDSRLDFHALTKIAQEHMEAMPDEELTSLQEHLKGLLGSRMYAAGIARAAQILAAVGKPLRDKMLTEAEKEPGG